MNHTTVRTTIALILSCLAFSLAAAEDQEGLPKNQTPTAQFASPAVAEPDLTSKLLEERPSTGTSKDVKNGDKASKDTPVSEKTVTGKRLAAWKKWTLLAAIVLTLILVIAALFLPKFLKKRKRRKAFEGNTCITIDPEDGRPKKKKKNKFGDPFSERTP